LLLCGWWGKLVCGGKGRLDVHYALAWRNN
jgi:hypothetical protein